MRAFWIPTCDENDGDVAVRMMTKLRLEQHQGNDCYRGRSTETPPQQSYAICGYANDPNRQRA